MQQAIKSQSKPESTDIPTLKYKLLVNDDRQIWLIICDTPLSETYILKVRGNRAVKPNDTAIESILDEYTRLESCWKYIKQSPENLSMSAPIAVQPELGLILMSFCQGRNLNDEFNFYAIKRFKLPKDFTEKVSNCGKWLGNLHSRSLVSKESSEFVSNRAEHFNRMLEQSGLTIETQRELSTYFHQRLRGSQKIAVCMSHGNFALRNVMGHTGGVSLVDFEDARVELFAYDLGQFIAELLYKSQYPWIRLNSIRQVISSFLDGYKDAANNSNLAEEVSAIQALTGYHLLCHLYELTNRSSKPSFPQKIIFGHRKRVLIRLLNYWATDMAKE